MMNDASQTILNVPWVELIPVVLLAVVGVVFWAAGRRVLRPGIAAVGLIIGGGLGWAIGSALNLGVPAWAVAIVAGLLLACIAALAHRLAVAAALAVVLGLAPPMAVIAVGQLGNVADALGEFDIDGATENDSNRDSKLTDEFTKWLDESGEARDDDDARDVEHSAVEREDLDGELRDELADAAVDRARDDLADRVDIPQQAREQLARVKSFFQWLGGEIGETWNNTPERQRPALVIAAVFGVLVGAILGTLAPTFSSIIVTAFGGAMLWLFCAGLIVQRAELPAISALSGADRWLLLWLITSLVGVGIQWMFRPRKADTSR